MISDSLPIPRYFSICVGMIGMKPNTFWNTSPQEIYMAITGFIELNGGKETEAPMDSNRLNEMRELYPDE